MSFLLRWLGLDAPLRDARLRPYRRFECAGAVAVHRERARRAMNDVLGATITRDDDDALVRILFLSAKRVNHFFILRINHF